MNPPRRLTNDQASDAPTAWTPNSKTVLLSSNRNGTSGIFKQELTKTQRSRWSQDRKVHSFRALAPMETG
jgi:Tol biopolymer transport system component